MLTGVLNIYKERGYTSQDVISRMRGILRMKRLGHGGTLDPDAEGVLPVFVGGATRFIDLVSDRSKAYRCGFLLGASTDTQDTSGTVLSVCHGPLPGEDEVRAAVESFLGGYDQLPPMFSAKKVNGKRLYDLAREGKDVERSRVAIEIPAISMDSYLPEGQGEKPWIGSPFEDEESRKLFSSLPLVYMTVECSKGTYIRTLSSDIGEKLGCGACMCSLERIRSGSFHVEEAVRLDELETIVHSGQVSSCLVPVEELFLDCLRVSASSEEAERKLLNGNPLKAEELDLPEMLKRLPAFAGSAVIPEAMRVRMCDRYGRFRGLYRYRSGKEAFYPEKLLPDTTVD